MAVTLDHIANRYGMLPSEVLIRATTFDLEIFDISKSWERYKSNKAHGVMPDVKQEVLEEVLEKVRNGDNKSKN